MGPVLDRLRKEYEAKKRTPTPRPDGNEARPDEGQKRPPKQRQPKKGTQ